MKIFILNPFLFTGKLSKLSRKRQPLSMAYIASLLRNDHDIKLLDANALNLSLEDTIEEIKKFNPEVLVLTSTPVDRWEVPSHAHIKLLANNIIKTVEVAKIPITVLAGAHGTLMPEWILEKSKVNFVVRREPELVVAELIKALDKKKDLATVEGISYIKDGKIVNNIDAKRIRDLDSLPFPAYDLLPMDKYRYTQSDIPVPFSIMMTSRGCPFNCIYCLKVMMERFYIMRSPENVIAEMKYLAEKFGVKGIYFQDWEFVINRARALKICDLIIEEGLDIKWGCNARVSDIDDEVAKKMKQAGCVRINIGFESGSQKILDIANKKITVEQTKNCIDVLRKYDINIGLYSILNLPGEDRDTIKETEKFLADNKLETLCEPNLPIPYFSTEMYEMLKKQEGREFDWENLEKFAGRVNVKQAPWLARLYRWHYKYTFTKGRFYFISPSIFTKVVKKIKLRFS